MSSPSTLADARAAIAPLYRYSEPELLAGLAARAELNSDERSRVLARAQGLLDELRSPGHGGWIDRFLQEYALNTDEGAALLGLAEAYLRVPDAPTADALIRDKLTRGDWKAHVGASGSFRVNSATLGLILAQTMAETSQAGGTLRAMIARLGEPAVRLAVAEAMQRMGEAFVLGRDIGEALKRADRGANRAFRYSFDMLGEGARTQADGDRYFEAYAQAVQALVDASECDDDVFAADSVSVKLSALHPRYEPFQADRAVPFLTG
ncbi:MAG TPA: proline dehydrogenase family protein, partial [Caulobacteraceae bacterium]|nr:proline dehydrogenase family protein [Caulobacteraceae bacterium]